MDEILSAVAEFLNGDDGFKVGVDSARVFMDVGSKSDNICISGVAIQLVGPERKRYALILQELD